MQDASSTQELRKSLSQRIFCLKSAYKQEEENELNSFVPLSKVWLARETWEPLGLKITMLIRK